MNLQVIDVAEPTNNWLKKSGVVTAFIIGVITISTFVVSFIGKMYERGFVQAEHQKQIQQIGKQLNKLQKAIIELKLDDADFQSQVNEQISGIEKRVDKLPAINWWIQENVRAVNKLGEKVNLMMDSSKVQ